MSGFVSKSAAFLEKSSFSCSFFAPDCHKINVFFNFFSAIYKVNPAIPLCRTGVGWTPPSSGRFAVSQDHNEHFFVDRRGSSFDKPSPGLSEASKRESSGMADGKVNNFPHRKCKVFTEKEGVKAAESWRPPRDLR